MERLGESFVSEFAIPAIPHEHHTVIRQKKYLVTIQWWYQGPLDSAQLREFEAIAREKCQLSIFLRFCTLPRWPVAEYLVMSSLVSSLDCLECECWFIYPLMRVPNLYCVFKIMMFSCFFFFKESLMSLGAGLLFGSVMGFGAYQMYQDPKNIMIFTGSNIVLGGIMWVRFQNTGKLMPAGTIAILRYVLLLRGYVWGDAISISTCIVCHILRRSI